MSTMITGAKHIKLYQLMVLKAGIKLEILGMTRRGQSSCKIAKLAYGLKGNKASILKQVEQLIADTKAISEIEPYADTELAEGDPND